MRRSTRRVTFEESEESPSETVTAKSRSTFDSGAMASASDDEDAGRPASYQSNGKPLNNQCRKSNRFKKADMLNLSWYKHQGYNKVDRVSRRNLELLKIMNRKIGKNNAVLTGN